MFTLESESYEFSESCSATECLCNTNSGWERWSAPANNGTGLPAPLLVKMPSYLELERVALNSELTDDQSKYYRELYNEF